MQKITKKVAKIEKIKNKELEGLVLCVKLDNALRLLQEMNIYFTKLKNNEMFSIDELITPVENAMKVYLNFEKKYSILTPTQILRIRKIILDNESNFEVERLIKIVAPSLFEDITTNEFITNFEIFNERMKRIYKQHVTKDILFEEYAEENSR